MRWALAAALALAIAPSAHAAVPRTQILAILHAPAQVYYGPRAHAARDRVVSQIRPLTHTRTVLPVLARRPGWLYVLLPGRPNGHAGWIRAGRARLTWTPWRIVVHTARARLDVYRLARRVASFPVVIGKASTPTPVGRFFVEEAMSLRPGTPGSPYALALSARSTVYQEFEGGPGQVAIHGVYGIGGTLGTAVSHGCIRMSSAALEWIVHRFGTGIPVTIRR